MKRAAGVITSDNTDQSQRVIEAVLNAGTPSATYTITASGKTPVVATLCWTDPPGIPVNLTASMHNFVDTGRKLINDLDLRIVDNATNKTFFPWTLTDQSRRGGEKADNIRDNVEKVELGDSLVPGHTYTINVTPQGHPAARSAGVFAADQRRRRNGRLRFRGYPQAGPRWIRSRSMA